MLTKAFEFLGYGVIMVMLLGWTNVFGDKLNWWYLAFYLGN